MVESERSPLSAFIGRAVDTDGCLSTAVARIGAHRTHVDTSFCIAVVFGENRSNRSSHRIGRRLH